MPADQQFLVRQRQGWYVRRRVPVDLRDKINKTEIVKSLQTRDLGVAQSRRWAALEEIDTFFDRLRGQDRQDEQARRDQFRAALEAMTEWDPGSDELKTKRLEAAMDALEGAGREDSPEFAAAQAALQEHKGRPIKVQEEYQLRFSEASQRYLRELQRDPDARATNQTINQTKAVFRLFREWSGDAPLERVDRKMASRFLDDISVLDPNWGKSSKAASLSVHELLDKYASETGLSNRTLNRYVSSLSQVWKWAERRGLWSGVNPFSNQMRKQASSKKTGWLPLEDHEVNAVLNLRPADTKDPLHWVPLIMAYSGMRIGEVCSLDVINVRQERGVWYFDITQSKTEAGVRTVPIHSAILEAGFLDYLHSLPEDGAASQRRACCKLFPTLRPGGPDGKLSWNLGKRLGRLIDKAGITEKRKVAHSFRKSFATKLERAGVPENEAVEVLGHEKLSMSYSVYSAGLSIERLKEIVNIVAYH